MSTATDTFSSVTTLGQSFDNETHKHSYSSSSSDKGYYEIDPKTYESTNPFISLVHNQHIVNVPEFTLESGYFLQNIPIAYKTWGRLNSTRDNVIVISHALTGSSDVSDWWGPLLGKSHGKAFDYSKYFIICLNSMGSPYGSFSPLSIDPKTGLNYGPEFPLCTVRDDVRIHHQILVEYFNIASVQCCIGGSMGGMLTLEYAHIFGEGFVKSFVALATSARHSAWCISWSEAQRQSIYSDPKYLNGYYSLQDPPTTGLSAARMSALLTYRSRNSFEGRFSRGNNQKKNKTLGSAAATSSSTTTPSPAPKTATENVLTNANGYATPTDHNLKIHNDGHKPVSFERKHSNSSSHSSSSSSSSSVSSAATVVTPVHQASSPRLNTHPTIADKQPQTFFSAQSYLRYQGEKFIKRFDANCYISITRKLDTHDLQRGHDDDCDSIEDVLQGITQKNIIIGIESDGLFTYSEQEFLADNLPNSTLYKIDSIEGHDAFLLEFKQINEIIRTFLAENCPIDESTLPPSNDDAGNQDEDDGEIDNDNVKPSLFGEAEEVTNW